MNTPARSLLADADHHRRSFESAIPDTLRKILAGTTLSSRCGMHEIARNPDGSVKLSRASAEAVLNLLMGRGQ